MNRNSEEVIAWMRAGKSRTVEEIIQEFPGRGHAIVVMILMLLPATPLPTGILSHVFEIIAALLLIQSLIGIKGPWLPQRLKRVAVSGAILRGMSNTLSALAKLESRLKMRGVTFSSYATDRIVNVLTLICVVGAFLAPPFSGLDTLPSIGAVLLSLSLVLNSALFACAGLIIGAVGVGIEISLSKFIYKQLMNVLG